MSYLQTLWEASFIIVLLLTLCFTTAFGVVKFVDFLGEIFGEED